MGETPPVVVVVVVGTDVGPVGTVVLDVVVDPVVGVVDWLFGVTDTSWKIPKTSWNTTTIAEVLVNPTFKLPVPWPPVVGFHEFHVMSVTVVFPLAHPMTRFLGRTVFIVPGAHDNTATVGDVVGVVRGEVVPGPCEVVEAPLPVEVVVDDGELEATFKPTANPMASAATTSTPMPIRMAVLRRIVMTRGSLFTTQRNRSPRSFQFGRRVAPRRRVPEPRRTEQWGRRTEHESLLW